MKPYFKSKFFYIITVLTLAAVIIPTVLCSMGLTGVLRSAAGSIMTPLRRGAQSIVDAIDGYAAYFYEFDRLVEENERLRKERAELLEEVHKSRELEEQYDWISEYLELKMQHTDYKMTPADVCGRESGNYSTAFMLDVGSSSGIRRNMTVVTGAGVLGYISEVGGNWSKASSILESSSALGVYDERSGESCVMEGDYTLAREGLCRLRYLEEGADVKVGDRILTSGYGSVYPRGLTVGYVERIEENEYSRSLVAYVRPAAFAEDDADRISQVMIITDYETYTEE